LLGSPAAVGVSAGAIVAIGAALFVTLRASGPSDSVPPERALAADVRSSEEAATLAARGGTASIAERPATSTAASVMGLGSIRGVVRDELGERIAGAKVHVGADGGAVPEGLADFAHACGVGERDV